MINLFLDLLRKMKLSGFLSKSIITLYTIIRPLLPNKYFLFRYVGGKIHLNLKESASMMYRALSIYELPKTKLLQKVVKPGMIVIDVGANKGYFTFLFAKLVGDDGKVLSFEPEPSNCYWIRKSITANNYKNIKLFELALSDKKGETRFFLGKLSGWGSLFYDEENTKKESITVKTKRLDDVLKEELIADINIIKIDVQGSELKVLRGAKKLLMKSKKVKLAMDVDLKSAKEREELFKFLTGCGFKIYNISAGMTPINKEISDEVADIYAVKEEK